MYTCNLLKVMGAGMISVIGILSKDLCLEFTGSPSQVAESVVSVFNNTTKMSCFDFAIRR